MARHAALAVAIGCAITTSLGLAQNPPPPNEASVPVTYVGSNLRLSLGINQHGDVLGEILGILGKTDDHAWLAQLWLGQRGAGGVQVDYHWLHGTPQRALEHPEAASVFKVFGALDQNVWKDRKATLGAGWEKNDFSIDAYLSHATTGTRLVRSTRLRDVTQLNGRDERGDWTQTQTIETLTDLFEHPYDHGIGARFGRYFDAPLLRVRGGLDYERGKHASSQWTVSLGVDKYFRNTGFSLSLTGEALRKRGDFEVEKNDTRAWLMLRYGFGETFRPVEPYRMVQVERAASDTATPPRPPEVVRNEVRLDGDAFFDFDRFNLRPDAVAALDALVARLKSVDRVSRVRVVGHTDSVGSVAYNQKLSERRAASAKRHLVQNAIPADQIDTVGAGELNPSHPNDTAANRQKNRRVDVEFLTIEESSVAPPPPDSPKVEWVREPVQAPPAWIERALRNPAEHKRTVDVYRFARSTQTTTLGERQYLNRPPVAVDDAITVARDSQNNPVAVLANDRDPDGDPLTVTAVTPPTHGTATFTATGTAYTPTPGYVGSDSFTYSISDGHGGTATATVHVTIARANQPPVAGPMSVRVLKGASIDIPVLQVASDPDGDPLTVVSVRHTGPVTINLVSINSDNTVHYESVHGMFGQDWFEYTVSDGQGGTATGVVQVYVYEPWPI